MVSSIKQKLNSMSVKCINKNINDTMPTRKNTRRNIIQSGVFSCIFLDEITSVFWVVFFYNFVVLFIHVAVLLLKKEHEYIIQIYVFPEKKRIVELVTYKMLDA